MTKAYDTCDDFKFNLPVFIRGDIRDGKIGVHIYHDSHFGDYVVFFTSEANAEWASIMGEGINRIASEVDLLDFIRGLPEKVHYCAFDPSPPDDPDGGMMFVCLAGIAEDLESVVEDEI